VYRGGEMRQGKRGHEKKQHYLRGKLRIRKTVERLTRKKRKQPRLAGNYRICLIAGCAGGQ